MLKNKTAQSNFPQVSKPIVDDDMPQIKNKVINNDIPQIKNRVDNLSSSNITLPETEIKGNKPGPITDEKLPITFNQSTAPHSKAVIDMQSAILNIATALSKNSIASNTMPGRTPSPTDKAKQDQDSKADPFGNFLAENYVPKDTSSGGQTTKDNSLRNMVRTMQSVGMPGKENIPDGQWGPRTQNALKQILGIATALISFANDIGVNVKGDLTAFNNNMPKSNGKGMPIFSGVNDMNKKAEFFKGALETIFAFYSNFETQILNKPEYKNLIMGDKPLFSKQKSDALTPEENKILSNNPNLTIPLANIDGKQIPFSSLKDISKFQEVIGTKDLLQTKEKLKQLRDSLNIKA